MTWKRQRKFKTKARKIKCSKYLCGGEGKKLTDSSLSFGKFGPCSSCSTNNEIHTVRTSNPNIYIITAHSYTY